MLPFRTPGNRLSFMHLCLFEDDRVAHLAPLTTTRPAVALRLGLHPVLRHLHDAVHPHALRPQPLSLWVRPALAEVTAERFPHPVNHPVPEGDVFFVNARYVPEAGPVLERLRAIRPGDAACAFVQEQTPIAAWLPDGTPRPTPGLIDDAAFADLPTETLSEARLLRRPWHLLDGLRDTIRTEAAAYDPRGGSAMQDWSGLHSGVTVGGGEALHLHPTAEVHAGAVLDASAGPILLGARVQVLHGAILRGPLALGAGTTVRVGANLEGCATGPGCLVGGEVHTTVLHGYANKAHDGFLGHAVVGSWGNLGAGTTNSNLRNDAALVPAYDAAADAFVRTDRHKLGCVLGDFVWCGIGTLLDTGTVLGPGANLYGGGLLPRHVPPFRWGRAGALAPFHLAKFLDMADAWMQLRGRTLSPAFRRLLTALHAELA